MGKDYDKIMALIARNDYFYNSKQIGKDEYIYNNLFLASRLEYIIHDNGKNIIKDFLEDTYSLAKFKISIEILKTVTN